MRLDNLMEYDKIVAWGAGQDFKSFYKKNIHIDYIVEKDTEKIGTTIYGIPICLISKLEECDKNKRILIIIFTSKYYDEVVEEISKMSINCDYISVWEYYNIFDLSVNRHFSVYGMDANVIETLKLANLRIEDMNYIDVGGAHPVFGNQTYAMYLKGARGVIVEPNPEFVEDIKRLRPEDVCFNCGVGPQNDVMVFYRLNNKYRGSFDINSVNDNINKGYKYLNEVDIKVKTLESIIEESGVDPSKTYLSFIVMGLEYDVLKGFDYKKYNFPIIQVIYHDDRVRTLDLFKDYVEISKVVRRSILVRREIYDAIYRR